MATAAETRAALADHPTGDPDPERTPAPEATPEAAAEPTPTEARVSRAAFDEVVTQLRAAGAQIEELKSTAALISKAKQLFAPEGEAPPELSAKDQLIRTEITRLFPGLKHLEDVPKITEALQTAGKAAQEQLSTAAWEYQRDLQKEYDIFPGDDAKGAMLGENVRAWITADQGRAARYFRGDKTVLREGFEHVVGSLYGKERLERKRRQVAARERVPVVPARGGAPAPAGQGKNGGGVDFSSRKSVRSALAAALNTAGEE